MAKLPKLKVKGLGWDEIKEIYNFDQAKYLPFGRGVIITVEGQVINSYQELSELMKKGHFKNKEFLEVAFLEIIAGG